LAKWLLYNVALWKSCAVVLCLRFLFGRSNRPHYDSCQSAHPSVRPCVLRGLSTRKPKGLYVLVSLEPKLA